ncbi:MAG TPA: hypothetical protein PKY48_09985 [Rhodoglobus sp.]|nr:hypothetical protein [Rhodoglobus sp.]
MRELKLLTGRRVVVATEKAELRGVVESATRAFLTLTAADDVTSGPPRPIVGFVLVPVPRIAHVQVID